MQHAINDHQDEFEMIILNAIAENGPMFPKDIINPIRANSRRIMTYIAGELSSPTDGRQSFSESQLELIRDQAKEQALHNSQQGTAPPPSQATRIPQTTQTIPDATPPAPSMIGQYEVDLQNAILNHRDSIMLLLKEFPSHKDNAAILSSQYEVLRSANFPLMTSLAEIIAHLGGQEIPRDALISLVRQAEEEALQLYTSTILPDNSNPLQPVDVTDLIPLPTNPNSSLKPSKLFPLFTQPTPICNTNAPSAGKTADDLTLYPLLQNRKPP
jgi:hypothetical protein